MSRYKQIASVGLCTVLMQGAVLAQEDLGKTLVEQGLYWQDRNDLKRAAEAWNKLLLLAPDDARALSGLARAELAAKQPEKARQYIERLKKAHPGNPLIAQLEQEMVLASGANQATLEQARKLAASGNLDQAVAAYRSVLGGRQPQGDVGREYYTYLGYTEGGLNDAITGLRRLLKETPSDTRVAVALARHLARNDATRTEGIRMLATLAGRSDTGKDVTESWRTALTWISPTQASAQVLFREYLKAHPEDKEIAALLQKGLSQQVAARTDGARADAARARTSQAMELLEMGDLTGAEAELKAILAQRPNDNQALGSLGVLYMRQGYWAKARDYLERARKGSPNWQEALNTVSYWTDVERSKDLIQERKFDQARRLLNQAARRQPKEVGAQVMLADILLEEGKVKEAKSAYDAILARKPGDPGALEGIAKVARRSGDLNTARLALEAALGADASNPWLRYELAGVYQELGYTQEARGLIEGILLTNPNDPQALYVAAMMASQRGETARTYDMLSRIPAELRSTAMNRLLESTERKLRVDQAVQLAKAGRKQEALAVLAQVQASGQANDIDTISAVARAYVDLGEPGYGLVLLRPLRQQGGARSIDASLVYAELLMRSNQDVEAAVVMRSLDQQNLTSTQRQALTDISDSYRVRQADALRERGDLVAAYDILSPVLERKPRDVGAIGALARMYAAAGSGDQALALYENLLQADPDNPELRLGAAQAAMQAKNHRYAARQADIAVSLAPNRIDVLSSAARIYRDQGKTSEASKLLKRALELEGQSGGNFASATMVPGQAPRSHNPFVGLPGQRSVSALDAASYPVAAAAAVPGYPQAAANPPPGSAYPQTLPPPVNAGSAMPGTITMPPMANSFVPQGMPADQRTAIAPPVPVGARSAAPSAFATTGVPNYAALSPLQRELDALQQDKSPQISVGTQFRSRDGEPGTSRLDEIQVPMQVSLPVGDGKVDFRVTPVALDAGSLGSDPYALAGFGGGAPAYLANPDFTPKIKSAQGVGLSVGYQGQGYELDVGSTPLGFQEQTIVGGLLLTGTMDEAGSVSYRVDLSRRAVTDSMLSFAGMQDPRTGQKWGGVTATGARASVAKDFGDAGIYGEAAWHSLRGNNVASNQRMEFNTGAYFRLINELDAKLTAGVNLNATFFDKNLGHYTLGHGGYFSPKSYYALAFPVDWAQRSDRMTYRVHGAIGIQRSKQDEAPMFPNNSELQAMAQSNIPGIANGYFEGSTKTDLAYNLQASAEYRMAPNWSVGATVGTDNASDYHQWAGGLFLRYYFYPQNQALDLPTRPHRSPYGDTYGR